MGQQPFTIFHYPFLMTKWAKLPALTGKRQKILMTAFFAAHPGKSHMEVTAIQVSINHSHDVCPSEAQAGCIHIVPRPFKFFKMILNTYLIYACLWISWLVNIKIISCWLGHGEIDNNR